MTKMNSLNGEIVRIAPPTPHGGFHKGFARKSYESHVTKIFIG